MVIELGQLAGEPIDRRPTHRGSASQSYFHTKIPLQSAFRKQVCAHVYVTCLSAEAAKRTDAHNARGGAAGLSRAACRHDTRVKNRGQWAYARGHVPIGQGCLSGGGPSEALKGACCPP